MRFWRWLTSLFRKPDPLYMGSYVFCGWASPRPEVGLVPGIQCPTATPWDLKTQDRVPQLGFYDERDPIVTATRLAWMQRGKLDYCVYQVDWRHDVHELLMDHCAENHPSYSRVKFCLSFFDVLANTKDDTYYLDLTDDELEASRRAFARAVGKYMGRSNYLKVDDKPVLFLGYAHNWSTTFIQILREELGPLYLVATACEQEAHHGLKSKGFDAFTEYLLYSVEGWPGVVNAYRAHWRDAIEVSKLHGIDYWVPACAGFNGAAWGIEHPPFMPTPAEFTAHLKEARDFARANAQYTKGRVISYAWNEFGEGGILEPLQSGMIRSGDEMLLAHAKAVT